MTRKIVAALVAALTLGSVNFASTSQAQAHHWSHWSRGRGGVGLGLALGTPAAAS